MPNPLGTAAIGIGTGLIDTAINLGLDKERRRRDVQQQKHMMDFQQKKQLEFWEATGFQAQRRQLEKAGLNPALLYGMSGEGSTTTGGGLPGISSHEIKSETGMGIQSTMQLALLKAQKENIEADTRNKNVDATKKEGVDTEAVKTGIQEAQARMDQMAQATDNMREEFMIKRLQQTMMHMQNFEHQASQQARLKIIDNTAQESTAKLKIILNDAEISQATKDELIKITQQQLIEAGLKNALLQANIKLTDQQTQKTIADVSQGWTQLAQNWKGLDQKDKELKIRTFEAQIKAAYPGIGNVIGHVWSNAMKQLDELTGTQSPQPTMK